MARGASRRRRGQGQHRAIPPDELREGPGGGQVAVGLGLLAAVPGEPPALRASQRSESKGDVHHRRRRAGVRPGHAVLSSIMREIPPLSLDTLCIHAGQEPDPSSGAVMTPIVLASTFAQDGPGNHKGYDYSRAGNPTRAALEGCYAALEGAKHGAAFGSGCAAATALLMTLTAGDHVLAGDDLYGGTFRIFDKVMKPFGLGATFIDMSDPKTVESALTPKTRMIWLETPSNPLLKMFDIEAIARVAGKAKIPFVVDNTFATPILQRPLDLGATA